jgi:hypothetical protein
MRNLQRRVSKSLKKEHSALYYREGNTHRIDEYQGDLENKFYVHAYCSTIAYSRPIKRGSIFVGYWKVVNFRMDY